MPPVRLQHKYVILISSLVALAIIILTLVVSSIMRSQLKSSMIRRGKMMAELIAKSSAESAMVGNFSELAKDVERLGKKKDVVYVIMISKEGKVVLSSLNPKTHLPYFKSGSKFSDQVGKKAVNTNKTLIQNYRFKGEDVIDISTPMTKYGEKWGTVRIGFSPASVEFAISRMNRLIFLLATLVLGIGVGITMLLTRRIVLPILQLVEGTKKIAEGDLKVRVGINTRDEIEILGNSFNKMAGSLEEKTQALQDANEKLKEQLIEIKQKNRETQTIYTVVERISATIEKEKLMESVLEVLTKMLEANYCYIYVYNRRRDVLESFCKEEEKIEMRELSPGNLGISDFSEIKSFPEFLMEWKEFPPADNSLTIPLLYKNEKLGIINIQRKDGFNFTENDKNLLTAIGHHLTIALENARLYEEAVKDGLTNLYIKRYFVMRLKEEVRRFKRYGGPPFSLIMMDIDHFKKINDTYGHLMGDEVLKKLGELLLKRLRTTDIPARFGGEEFSIILIGQPKDKAFLVAEDIRHLVENAQVLLSSEGEKKNIKFTVSLGVSTFPEDGDEDEILIEKADSALYQAKKQGRNKTCVWGVSVE